MIRNVVFDLGNVLVEFKPKNYLESLGITDPDKLSQLIFKDPRWNEFDRGTIQIENYVNDLKKENPEYAEYFDMIFCENWVSKLLKPKEKSIEFLKKQVFPNYKIYILSNVSQYTLSYIRTLDFFPYVTSGTYSYLVRSCKPEEEIYRKFFKENRVIPQECLFLDDLPANIETARRLGMHGIVFNDNIEEVKSYLQSICDVSIHKSECDDYER